jgi:hypothetical protein
MDLFNMETEGAEGFLKNSLSLGKANSKEPLECQVVG